MSERPAERFAVVSPVDGTTCVERPVATPDQLETILRRAHAAAPSWAELPLEQRARLCNRAMRALAARRQAIAHEITLQMGRPVTHSARELDGALERALYMTRIAPRALEDVEPDPLPGLRRFVRRVPHGVVLTIAPWNYPYLTAVNSIVPALTAGNCVVLKHSPQVPLCAERFAAAFSEAGLPPGVFQIAHCGPQGIEQMIRSDAGPDFVVFTGSVEAGRAVQGAAAARLLGTGLELGGKDPAYVRLDADVSYAAEGIADAAFYNAGQSCCAVERAYVHEAVHDAFLAEIVRRARAYRLDDPRSPTTTLGPLVSVAAAERVRARVAAAIAQGATPHLDPTAFPASRPGTAYLAPQVLTGVRPAMEIQREETFGPVLTIVPVRDDTEAIAHMNDSRYGLTASIWTTDENATLAIGESLQTGTVFMNRADYLDPGLAWTGVKDSGRGCSLSRLGYEILTRPRSYHLRGVPGGPRESAPGRQRARQRFPTSAGATRL